MTNIDIRCAFFDGFILNETCSIVVALLQLAFL